ncbi:unnamed protein product, partial [Chrysoparadoxa australica]
MTSGREKHPPPTSKDQVMLSTDPSMVLKASDEKTRRKIGLLEARMLGASFSRDSHTSLDPYDTCTNGSAGSSGNSNSVIGFGVNLKR